MRGEKLTKEESERFTLLTLMGCIVCGQFYGIFTPAIIHHLTGLNYRCLGKRADHRHTIPLCPAHHMYGSNHEPSVHSHPKAFEERFGSQDTLLKTTDQLIEDFMQHGKLFWNSQ